MAIEFNAVVRSIVDVMDNKLFVPKYQLVLPKREEIERFLAEKLCEVGVADE